MLDKIERAAQLIADARLTLICGNGGSAAESLHFAAELLGRYKFERQSLPAVALLDPATITAIANDYGFESVFSRQISGLGRPGDVLVAISTSGNSPNVVQAACTAIGRHMTVISLTGNGGGELAKYSDIQLDYKGSTADVQESHLKAIHQICKLIDDRLAPKVTTAFQMGEHNRLLRAND